MLAPRGRRPPRAVYKRRGHPQWRYSGDLSRRGARPAGYRRTCRPLPVRFAVVVIQTVKSARFGIRNSRGKKGKCPGVRRLDDERRTPPPPPPSHPSTINETTRARSERGAGRRPQTVAADDRSTRPAARRRRRFCRYVRVIRVYDDKRTINLGRGIRRPLCSCRSGREINFYSAAGEDGREKNAGYEGRCV